MTAAARPNWPLIDDVSAHHLRITRVLLERAADDLEQLQRDLDGEACTKANDVLMLLFLALEEVPAMD